MGKIKVQYRVIVQAAFDEKMAENIQQRREVIDLKTECEKYKKISNDSAMEIEKLNSNIKKLTIQVKQRQEDISKLSQNAKVMDQEIKDHKSYIDKIKTNNDRLCSENSQLKTLHDEYMKENAQLWEQNKSLKSQLNERNGIIEELNNGLQLHKDQIDNLVPDNERMHQIMDDLKRQLEQATDDYKKVVEEGEVLRAQQSIKFQSMFEENKKLKDDVNKLKLDNERQKVFATNQKQAEFNSLLEGIKARNEERRKRKEAKLKRGTDEVRQKTMSKNLGYSTLGAPKEIGLSANPYMAKTRIEPPPPRNPIPNYYSS